MPNFRPVGHPDRDLRDVEAHIKWDMQQFHEKAKAAQHNAGQKPVAAVPQGPMSTPLRVKQVAPPGTPLALTHPSILTKG